MKTSELLVAGRNYLMEQGWRRTGGGGPGGDRCVHLALCEVPLKSEDELKVTRALKLLAEAITDHRPKMLVHAARSVWTFNDDPSTTFNDVVDIYDRAIILAKEQEA